MRTEDGAIFLFGFAKSERENVEPGELEDLRSTSRIYLGLDTEQLDDAVASEELWEVMCDDEAL